MVYEPSSFSYFFTHYSISFFFVFLNASFHSISSSSIHILNHFRPFFRDMLFALITYCTTSNYMQIWLAVHTTLFKLHISYNKKNEVSIVWLTSSQVAYFCCLLLIFLYAYTHFTDFIVVYLLERVDLSN